MVTRERVVKIMDFGLAKMLEEVRKGSTLIGGTPYYMAPEQTTGEGVGPQADLYALGVTLFELATGRVPFSEGELGQLLGLARKGITMLVQAQKETLKL